MVLFLKYSGSTYFFFHTEKKVYCKKELTEQTAQKYVQATNAKETDFLKSIPLLDFKKVNQVSKLIK